MPMAERRDVVIQATEEAKPSKPRPQQKFDPIHYAFTNGDVKAEVVEKILRLVNEQEKGITGTGKFHEMLMKCENIYNMIPWYREPPEEGMSNFGSPLGRIAVDTIVNKEMDVTFSMPEGPAQVFAGNEKDAAEKEAAEHLQRALSLTIQMMGKKRQRHKALFRTGIKCGDAWCKVRWERRVDVRVTEKEIIDPEVGSITVPKEEVVIQAEGPVMDWVDPKRMHFPKDFPDPETGPWLIEEIYYRPEDIRQRMQDGEFEKMKVEEQPLESQPSPQGGDKSKQDRVAIELNELEKVGYKKCFEAGMKWKSTVDKRESEWTFFVNATDKELYRAVRSKTPDRVWNKITPMPVEGMPRGESILMAIEQMWRYVNTFFNYIADTATFSSQPGGWVKKGSGNLNKKLSVKPREFRGVNNLDDIKLFDVPDVKQGILTAMQLILKFYQDVSGINDAVLGQFTAGVERPTARGTDRLLGQTSIRFEEINGNYQEGLSRVYRLMVWMMIYIGGDEYFKRLIDVDGLATYYKDKVEKSSTKSLNIDVKVLGNVAGADKGARQRKAMQMFEVLTSIPAVQNSPLLVAQLANHLVHALEARDMEGFTENLVQEMTAFQQQQQLQQQAQLGAPPAGKTPQILNTQGKPISSETTLNEL